MSMRVLAAALMASAARGQCPAGTYTGACVASRTVPNFADNVVGPDWSAQGLMQCAGAPVISPPDPPRLYLKQLLLPRRDFGSRTRGRRCQPRRLCVPVPHVEHGGSCNHVCLLHRRRHHCRVHQPRCHCLFRRRPAGRLHGLGGWGDGRQRARSGCCVRSSVRHPVLCQRRALCPLHPHDCRSCRGVRRFGRLLVHRRRLVDVQHSRRVCLHRACDCGRGRSCG